MRILALIVAVLLMLSDAARAGEKVSTSHNGLTLTGTLVMGAGKKVKDGVLLMVHGTMAHGQMEIMVQLQEILASAGVNSLSINLSYGQSDRAAEMYPCDRIQRHAHMDPVGEIVAWMDWLDGQGVSHIDLLGHSRGGRNVAIAAGQQDRPSLRKVVLVAPATWSKEDAHQRYKERYGRDLAGVMAAAQALVDQEKGDAVLENIGFLNCNGAKATAHAFVGTYVDDPNKDTPYAVEFVKKPVLVVAAGQDQVVPDLEEKIADVRNELVHTEIIEDAGHFFRDLYGEDLAELVVEFLVE